ncbi:MAG: ion channel [Bacteroidetes bacterium]|nr:ion channel [Bacteroidota bacterium]
MKSRVIFNRQNEQRNTGFGSQAQTQGNRLVNHDGSFNIIRKGLTFNNRFNPFHDLILMSWTRFNLVILAFYLTVNIIFASIYYYIGIEHLGGVIGENELDKFFEAFFFSTQTFTTVGFGRINPIGYMASSVAAIESLIGLMTFALATGLLYGKFSRPNAKLVHSDKVIIAPFHGETAVMLRIANARDNQLIECKARMMLSFIEKETSIRRFLALRLEYDKVSALSLSWTIVHPIDENSPLYGLSLQDMLDIEAELIFAFKGFDDTYSQTVHHRYSYSANEIVFGAKFIPMFERADDGQATILHFDKIGAYEICNLDS